MFDFFFQALRVRNALTSTIVQPSVSTATIIPSHSILTENSAIPSHNAAVREERDRNVSDDMQDSAGGFGMIYSHLLGLV